jgi:hypothetical protein
MASHSTQGRATGWLRVRRAVIPSDEQSAPIRGLPEEFGAPARHLRAVSFSVLWSLFIPVGVAFAAMSTGRLAAANDKRSLVDRSIYVA